MNQAILGIDISKDTFDVALKIEKASLHRVFKNDPVGFEQLRNWLASKEADHIHACMEATGQYGDPLADYLYSQGHHVSVVNPLRIKRYAQSKLHRSKTDKADAFLIAEFCAKEKPALWKPLPTNIKRLRQLVRRLDDLQTAYQQERNRLHSGLTDPWIVNNITDHLSFLQQSIRSTKSAIQELNKTNPELKLNHDLLCTIPGIGSLTASRLLAEIGDIHNFENAPQLAAFAGLNPKGTRSGTSVFKKTRISKEGRPFLRFILYLPAIVAMKCNPIIHEFCQRLLVNGLAKMAVVAAAMRKLLHLAFGILKHQKPFDPLFLADVQIPS